MPKIHTKEWKWEFTGGRKSQGSHKSKTNESGGNAASDIGFILALFDAEKIRNTKQTFLIPQDILNI
jgi:hypothetical protein